jgi:hypothetical protein
MRPSAKHHETFSFRIRVGDRRPLTAVGDGSTDSDEMSGHTHPKARNRKLERDVASSGPNKTVEEFVPLAVEAAMRQTGRRPRRLKCHPPLRARGAVSCVAAAAMQRRRCPLSG